jgi:hypothetical protein
MEITPLEPTTTSDKGTPGCDKRTLAQGPDYPIAVSDRILEAVTLAQSASHNGLPRDSTPIRCHPRAGANVVSES